MNERLFDAACVWPNRKIFFFKADEYIQYDIDTNSVDPYFPRKISEGWPGVFEEKIDAIGVWPVGSAYEGKAYFFRGDEYIRFDISSHRSDNGYPRKIRGGWPGLFERDIDAVCVWGGGTAHPNKAYFFRGDEYIRYDIDKDRADEGYPFKIHGN